MELGAEEYANHELLDVVIVFVVDLPPCPLEGDGLRREPRTNAILYTALKLPLPILLPKKKSGRHQQQVVVSDTNGSATCDTPLSDGAFSPAVEAGSVPVQSRRGEIGLVGDDDKPAAGA